MITVNQILGNINQNSNLRKKYEEMLKNNLCEKVLITRMESEKLRMRKSTDKKTDVAFMFEHNPNLRNDDVIFMDDNKMILLTLESESVAIITFKSYENKYTSTYQCLVCTCKFTQNYIFIYDPHKNDKCEDQKQKKNTYLEALFLYQQNFTRL